ncbi:MAG: hypothetical protein AB7G93_12630 [Bdellovibrionales bacterium]
MFFMFISAILSPVSWADARFARATTEASLRTSGEQPLVRGALELQSNQYVSSGQPYFRDEAAQNNTSLILDLNDERAVGSGWDAAIRARDEYSFSENWNYLNVHDLYVSRGPAWTRLSLGRRHYDWAQWESTWNSGVFQPRYMQNRLHPESAGLTGVFGDLRSGPWRLTVGLLALHIPEIGPHCYVDEDQLVSHNLWFHPPASRFNMGGEEGEIRYSLNKPRSSEVLSNPGSVAKLEFQAGGVLSRLSYAYKPVPQFALGFPSDQRVNLLSNDVFMDVEVNARLLYHHVINWDQGIQVSEWNLVGSVGYERPQEDPGPDNWTAQQFAPTWISSLEVSRPLEEEGPSAARVRLGVLRVQGGDAPDTGT